MLRISSRQSDVSARLQQLGVKIGIGDLETEFSSLDYLRFYRVSEVKISRALIGSGTRDPEASAMAQAIAGPSWRIRH